MKKSLLLTSCLCGLAASALHAAPDSLSLRVAPERDLIYNGGSREVLVQIELEGRRAENARQAPMNLARRARSQRLDDRSEDRKGAPGRVRRARSTRLPTTSSRSSFTTTMPRSSSRRSGRIRARPRRAETPHRSDPPRRRDGDLCGVKLGAEQLRRHLDRERVNRVDAPVRRSCQCRPEPHFRPRQSRP